MPLRAHYIIAPRRRVRGISRAFMAFQRIQSADKDDKRRARLESRTRGSTKGVHTGHTHVDAPSDGMPRVWMRARRN